MGCLLRTHAYKDAQINAHTCVIKNKYHAFFWTRTLAQFSEYVQPLKDRCVCGMCTIVLLEDRCVCQMCTFVLPKDRCVCRICTSVLTDRFFCSMWTNAKLCDAARQVCLQNVYLCTAAAADGEVTTCLLH